MFNFISISNLHIIKYVLIIAVYSQLNYRFSY